MMMTNDAFEDSKRPRRPLRRDDLHVEELDGEAVLYDPRNGSVHRFNATTLMIWNGCSGSQTPKDIAAGLVGPHSIPVDEALKVVDSVIAELEDRDLLHQHCVVADQQLLSSVSAHAEPLRQRISTKSPACNVQQADATETADRGISRRELLSCGVTKGVLAAPVISTFFAAGAFASGGLPNGASFDLACADLGSACVVIDDCCDYNGFQLECDTSTCGPGKCCCVKATDGPCTTDADCCDLTKSCVAGGPPPTNKWCN